MNNKNFGGGGLCYVLLEIIQTFRRTQAVQWIRIGWIRKQLFISMRIRIHEAKPMRIQADPIRIRILIRIKSQKNEFLDEKYT
jgi:hypothetical protein